LRRGSAWYKQYCPAISIDTALASSFSAELDAAGIPRAFYETEEGQFSCYIDLCKMKMGPSSYCEDDQMLALSEFSVDAVRETWEQIGRAQRRAQKGGTIT
jgi:hypothetical protein